MTDAPGTPAPHRPSWRPAVRRWLLLLLGLTLLLAGGGYGLYRYGRSLWQPLLARALGGTTVPQRLAEIRQRQPDLATVHPATVTVLALKAERELRIYLDGQRWETHPLTATSGGPGPKCRAGDRQIPEGIYAIETLNPDSSYHLSLRVGYPNADDAARAAAADIPDPGGDIYIHGKDASIGCLAIGDRAIERLFWVVDQAGLGRTTVLILPRDPRTGPLPAPPDETALYQRMAEAALRLPP